ncbi:MAG: flagellar hook-associated family protein [Mesorhizobium sp.]|nr:flagellar hook-associated family protein [Mesorhizobium sp.]
MKASFVSSNAISEAMRYQMMRMQADLVRSEKEVVTMRVADPGLVLGARAGQSISLSRDVNRLGTLIDSNGLVSSRLASTQASLVQLTDLANDLMPALTTALSGPIDPTIPGNQAKTALGTITSILNTTQNGEYLFAGINTDHKPLADFDAPGSPARAAFDAAFNAEFGFPISDPATASVTPQQMNDFIDQLMADELYGAGWGTNWSSAADQEISARITMSETSKASVSANEIGIKKLVMAAALTSYLLEGDFNENVQKDIIEKSVGLLGEAVGHLGSTQAEVGILQKRVESASERVSMQIDLFKLNINDLEGVDPYEASSRITSLLTQIEVSYSLTARIQQLSLVRFLG